MIYLIALLLTLVLCATLTGTFLCWRKAHQSNSRMDKLLLDLHQIQEVKSEKPFDIKELSRLQEAMNQVQGVQP